MFALASTIVAVGLAASLPATALVGEVTGPAAVLQSQSETRQEPVDINAATAEELQKIPGIGEALARRIIEFREEHGRFEKVDDLLNVRGIGVASLEKLRRFVVVKKQT